MPLPGAHLSSHLPPPALPIQTASLHLQLQLSCQCSWDPAPGQVLPPSLCCTAHSAWLLHMSWLPECNPSSLLPPTAWLNFRAERCLSVPINSNQIEPPRSHRGFMKQLWMAENKRTVALDIILVKEKNSIFEHMNSALELRLARRCRHRSSSFSSTFSRRNSFSTLLR